MLKKIIMIVHQNIQFYFISFISFLIALYNKVVLLTTIKYQFTFQLDDMFFLKSTVIIMYIIFRTRNIFGFLVASKIQIGLFL